jgi:hypothetical protein
MLVMDTWNAQSVQWLAGAEFQTISYTMLDGLFQQILAKVTQTAMKHGLDRATVSLEGQLQER